MKKSILLLVLVFTLLVSSLPIYAANDSEPIIYKETITVTAEGGRYKVGFAEIEFKKRHVDEDRLPATFEVQIYAEDGTVYIEFEPDAEEFIKKVHIRVKKYDGLIYDRATGENIPVTLKSQQILAEHFSRWAFHD